MKLFFIFTLCFDLNKLIGYVNTRTILTILIYVIISYILKLYLEKKEIHILS
jgi:hypothetical protein